MELLDRMMAIQQAQGAVSDEALRTLARETRTPLYRLEGLRGFYPVFRSKPDPRPELRVCRDIACAMRGGEKLCEALKAALGDQVRVEASSCLGRCDSAPAVTLDEVPLPGDLERLCAYVKDQLPLPEYTPTPPRRWPTDPYPHPEAHYGTLRRLLMEDRPEAVLETLKASGLRGMGGAGFPTGLKWTLTRDSPGNTKYVVCNADESEPGTFKDRMILEELPHLLIEAMVLGGWMIGAAEGVIYLRHEYGREHKALAAAIARAEQAGVLGDAVCNSSYSFRLRVFVSPGGYILGEETAMLEALQDQRGEPRNKPPFPTGQGLWGLPTLINNVETFAAIPAILARGAEWWREQGKGSYDGLKYISVSGDVAKPGVYCVPMGTTVRELLAQCGGMAGDKALAAFAPGGASSAFLPAAAADVALDFQALQDAESMLGSGAVIFVEEGRDLVALATNEVRFFRNESCGKCVPCRIGSEKAVLLLEAALAGNWEQLEGQELIGLLEELGSTMARTSICGLGQVALTPILSVIRHFPHVAATRLKPGEKSP